MSFKRKYNASDDVTQESNSRQSEEPFSGQAMQDALQARLFYHEMAGEDPATSSPYLALRDRIQDSRIKLKFYAKLQREQRDSLQALNLRISDLTEKKASLLKSIGDIKQRIALKNKFTEKLNQEVTQKLEADFKVRIKNSKELFLKSSAAKSNCEVRFPTKGEATALDAYTLIQGYLSNIKEVKEEEFSRPTFGTPANLKLRHQAREIAAETTAGATRLANFPNSALLATFKPKAMLDARSIYQEKMSEYFSAVSPLDYSVRQLCQVFPEISVPLILKAKSLLPKQLELKEKMLQLQEVKNELWNKIDAHCGANDPYYTDLERQRLYSRSILRALESVQIPSAEAIYQPPPLLKLRLSSGLEPNSALRKAARELAQVFEQLRHNRDSVMSLCRNLSGSVLNPPHLQDLGTLNFAELGKDAPNLVGWLDWGHDIPSANSVSRSSPVPSPFGRCSNCVVINFDYKQFKVLEGDRPLWLSPDAFLPLLVELKTQARLTHQLCSSLRRQACSHEATWDRSLRLWNSGSDRASDGVLDTSGFCEVEFRLGELASRAEASWAQLLDVCCPALLHANIVDIPNARALLHEIKEILCERDELLKTFAL
ncbi:hypothetical protein L0F63_001050 [Massospora cicadina]|nr:hypothetical protein L0F63_001050 [Massospora cicadina]